MMLLSVNSVVVCNDRNDVESNFLESPDSSLDKDIQVLAV